MSSNNPGKNAFNRNKSFGGGTAPTSPKKGGRGGARRSKSHDGSKLRAAATAASSGDDDGFTAVGGQKRTSGAGGGRGGGGRFANDTRTTPRGRMNPTSSFSRPRPSQSFNKPRPTGSFKKGLDNNSNATSPSQNKLHSSSSSLDGVGNDGPGRLGGDPRRSRSFNKPRPTGSFNAKNSISNSSSNNNNNSFSNINTTSSDASGSGSTAQQKRELYRRSTSRLTAYDVELFTTGDGKSQAQRSVTRLHVDFLMRARLSYMDPPPFGEDDAPGVDYWGPHSKCLWNDPTRRDQIEQVMQKYPNAIPLHMKKRTRIVSSKLGDTTTATTASVKGSASIVSEDADNSEGDDSSIGASMASIGGDPIDASISFYGQEDMNPLRKTLMLLNKLSWTTIDKLTPRLFEVLEQDVPNLIPTSIKTTTEDTQDNSENSEGNDSKKGPNHNSNNPAELSPMVVTILTLIVEKAQTEPHFSAMYAHLCKSLAERNMGWRKKILAHCQLEFEHDIAWHTSRLDERLEEKANRSGASMDDNSTSSTATEDMDREYQVLQLRKKYLGHVQFIGELFKLKLIKLDIMIWCLSRLLFNKEEVDEDNLECFAKLMTVVGEQAEALVKKGKCHQVAEEKWYQCWDRIYWLTGRKRKTSGKRQQQQPNEPPPKISSRIKFMLVDLLELEENDWVVRRETEKPKTIDEIHKEVRQEEEEARRRSYSDDWSGSSFGTRRRVNSDDYGRDYSRSPGRSPGFERAKKIVNVDADGFVEIPKRGSAVRRTQSDVEVSDLYNKQNTNSKKEVPASPAARSPAVSSQIKASNATPKIVEYPDPEECKEKTKTILKEYFIGGDTNDAIVSIDEIVGAGRDNETHGSVDRGAAVIEAGVLLVLEMKQQEVQKFLAVIKRCLQSNKIEKESLPLGLKDPLEFLSDIEIDAPMARSLLTSIVSYLIRQDAIPFNFLLDAPEYFRTACKAAEFAAGVLKMIGDDPSDEDLVVIEKLMTEEDKKKYASAKDMLVLT